MNLEAAFSTPPFEPVLILWSGAILSFAFLLVLLVTRQFDKAQERAVERHFDSLTTYLKAQQHRQKQEKEPGLVREQVQEG